MVNEFKATEGLAKWLVFLFAALALVHLITIPVELDRLAQLDRVDDGRATLDSISASEDREIFGGLGIVTVGLVLTVFFLVWFHRSYKNLSPLGVGFLRFGTGWAIGSWFVPILNLWRPKQIANDIWRGSDPQLDAHPGDSWHARPVAGLLHWWWAAWLLTSFTAFYGNFPDPNSVSSQRAYAIGMLVYAIVDLPAIALALTVVRRVTKRQHARHEAVGEIVATPISQAPMAPPSSQTPQASSPPPPPAPDDFRPRPGPD